MTWGVSHVPLQADGSASRGNRTLISTILVAGVFSISLIRLGGFVSDNAVDLLFDDQWDYLGPLFRGESPWSSFFYQHGPPRMGLGGFIEWFVYTATHWDVRAISWLGAGVLTLAAGTAIALAARLRGRINWSDLGFPLILLSPIHWESMTLTPSVAPMILPLLLTLLVVFSWTVEDHKFRLIAVSLFAIVDLFTGYGICAMPAFVGLSLLLALRPNKEPGTAERRTAIMILSAVGAALVAFFYGYQWAPGVPGWRFPVPNWWDYPRFCALMFTSLLGFRSLSLFGLILGGGMLVLVLTAFAASTIRIWRRDATARIRAIWLLTAVSLTYAGLTAVGRLPINIEAAFMWRYMTLMTLGLCGLALAADEWPIPKYRGGGTTLLILWVVIAGVVWSNFTPERYAAAIAAGKRRWVESYNQTHNLAEANKQSDFWVYYPEPASPRIAGQLHWLEQHHLSLFRKTETNKP